MSEVTSGRKAGKAAELAMPYGGGMQIAGDPYAAIAAEKWTGEIKVEDVVKAVAKPGLTFAALREANRARLPMFKNSKGETQHSGIDWTLNDWLIATVGEIGEACNLLKKVRRGDFTNFEANDRLSREFADVAIYLDLLADRMNLPPVSEWGSTFRELRTCRTRFLVISTEPNDCAARLVVRIGRVAEHVEYWMQGRAVGHRLAEDMVSVLYSLDELAFSCGIDMDEAVKATFNAKSDQLELDLYLTDTGYSKRE